MSSPPSTLVVDAGVGIPGAAAGIRAAQTCPWLVSPVASPPRSPPSQAEARVLRSERIMLSSVPSNGTPPSQHPPPPSPSPCPASNPWVLHPWYLLAFGFPWRIIPWVFTPPWYLLALGLLLGAQPLGLYTLGTLMPSDFSLAHKSSGITPLASTTLKSVGIPLGTY